MGNESGIAVVINKNRQEVKKPSLTINIVKALIENKNYPNFFQTSSSEMFEASVNEKLNEDSKDVYL